MLFDALALGLGIRASKVMLDITISPENAISLTIVRNGTEEGGQM
ncbi:MAG: hypothetical protein N2V78_07400 [Methanophagales archaeon]|nr:hypothetical protein [Methanophagales archaeon]